MNISEAAHAIGVSPTTLRKWDKRIPSLQVRRNGRGHREYDPQIVGTLLQIKKLEEQGRSFDSITVLLAPEISTDQPGLQDLEQALQRIDHQRQTIASLEEESGRLQQQMSDLQARLYEREERLAQLEREELARQLKREVVSRPWWQFWA